LKEKEAKSSSELDAEGTLRWELSYYEPAVGSVSYLKVFRLKFLLRAIRSNGRRWIFHWMWFSYQLLFSEKWGAEKVF